jgi:hypothetical protein
MPISTRIVMTLVAIALVTPFFLLFGTLCLDQFRHAQSPPSDSAMETNLQADNAAIANSGQPGIAGTFSETWICLWSKAGDYATVAAHSKLGIPGLLVTLIMLGLALYRVWFPAVSFPK